MRETIFHSHKLRYAITILIIAFILSATVYILNIKINTPLIQPDEGSYLSNASAIIGLFNDRANSYHLGYSFLISPAFLMGETPWQVWIWVKIINSILFFLTVIMLWKLANVFSNKKSHIKKINAVILVSIYPMWVVMAGYSFAQNAFVCAYLLAVYLHTQISMKKHHATWPLLGVSIGFLFWIHPIGAPVILAAFISLCYLSLNTRQIKMFFVFSITLIASLFLYKFSVSPWVTERSLASGNHEETHYLSHLNFILTAIRDGSFIKIIGILGGHIFYLAIGSLGFVISGCLYLLRYLFRKKEDGFSVRETIHRSTALFLLLSLLGCILLSSLTMISTSRIDQWIYGRYTEGVIAPILLIAVLSDTWRNNIWAVPIAIISVILLAIFIEFNSNLAPFNVTAFWQNFYMENNVWMWLISGIIPIIGISFINKRIAFIFTIMFFCFCSYLQIFKYHIPQLNHIFFTNRWDATNMIRNKYPVGTCIGFKNRPRSYQREMHWYDMNFMLFDYNLRRIEINDWEQKCDGPIFSSENNLDIISRDVWPIMVSRESTIWIKGEPEDLYPMNASNFKMEILLLDGWYWMEKDLIWSEKDAGINMPIPTVCRQRACNAILSFTVFGASQQRPVNVYFYDRNGNLIEQIPAVTEEEYKAVIPLNSQNTVRYLVRIAIPSAASPESLGASIDTRVLGIALRNVDVDLNH